MAFSIDNLLKKPPNESSANNTLAIGQILQNASATVEMPPFPCPWVLDGHTRMDMTDNLIGTSAPPHGMSPAAASLANQQLPTLADLQLLFGGGGPKAHYRRNRRSGADRKPRQAYSSKQLEKLEDEFKKDKYLSVSKRVDLSKTLNLSETQIKTWFQNRRTKWKKQVTASLRQLYRHGLYSQYAAAAAAANPACFLPMISAPTTYESMGAPQSDHASTSAMQPSGPWSVQSPLFLGLPGIIPNLGTTTAPESKEVSAGRSTSAASSCSSETSSVISD